MWSSPRGAEIREHMTRGSGRDPPVHSPRASVTRQSTHVAVRVAIDARSAIPQSRTGIGYYTWHLVDLLPRVDPRPRTSPGTSTYGARWPSRTDGGSSTMSMSRTWSTDGHRPRQGGSNSSLRDSTCHGSSGCSDSTSCSLRISSRHRRANRRSCSPSTTLPTSSSRRPPRWQRGRGSPGSTRPSLTRPGSSWCPNRVATTC